MRDRTSGALAGAMPAMNPRVLVGDGSEDLRVPLAEAQGSRKGASMDGDGALAAWDSSVRVRTRVRGGGVAMQGDLGGGEY